MSSLLPRIERASAEALLDELTPLSVPEIGERMPVQLEFTYAPTGGVRAKRGLLTAVRTQVLELAAAAGYPEKAQSRALPQFESECSRMRHRALNISPHEAGHREVWACLTAGHLLDVAAWRWGGITDRKRANGDVNRDTFRRLWWRHEILGDTVRSPNELPGLREDEIVAILERPGVTGNPEVAKAIANGFWARLVAEPDLVPRRMMLMRDAMKRLTRLSPFTAFDLLRAAELEARIDEVMGEAGAAVRTMATTTVAS
jgi:hypothetical protein